MPMHILPSTSSHRSKSSASFRKHRPQSSHSSSKGSQGLRVKVPASEEDQVRATVLNRVIPNWIHKRLADHFESSATPVTGAGTSRPISMIKYLGKTAGLWLGRLQGWARCVIKHVLCWPWIRQPPVDVPHASVTLSSDLQSAVKNMLLHQVIDVTSGPVFLSQPFIVLKGNYVEEKFILDLSIQN